METRVALGARRQLLQRFLLGSSALALAGCASPQLVSRPEQIVAPAKFSVGSRWIYNEINRYNNLKVATVTHEVTAISPLIQIARSDDIGRELAPEVYDSAWLVKQEPNYDVVQVFEKPLALVPLRLEAGFNEKFFTNYRAAGGSSLLAWQMHMRVPGWEKIVVPAGEFTALRIERTMYFRHFDVFRSDSLRTDTIWFAPQVNHWVRREWTGQHRSPGSRRVPMREDWVRWDLVSSNLA